MQEIIDQQSSNGVIVSLEAASETDKLQEEHTQLAVMELKARKTVEKLRKDLAKAEQEHRDIAGMQAENAKRLLAIHLVQSGLSNPEKKRTRRKG